MLESHRANNHGRDFIVGDIHGRVDLVYEALNKVRFDPSRDRLFSVGDLIDRGPSSYDCLMLLKEPWFYAVMGNHEAMMLTYLGLGKIQGGHSAGDFFYNGGRWFEDLKPDKEKKIRDELVPLLLKLPLMRKIDHKSGGFWIAHAERPRFVDSKMIPDNELTEKDIEYNAPRLLWSRSLVRTALPRQSVPGSDWQASSPLLIKGCGVTYVGHSVVERPRIYASHMFIDTGAYATGKLTLVDHAHAMSLLHAAQQVLELTEGY
jgi:serine/threonine protein phosphatase 1